MSNDATNSFTPSSIAASLTVKNLEASMKWYGDVVGFSVARTYERGGKVAGAVMQAGDVQLMLGQDDGAKGWERVKGEGFSLNITTTQSIDDIANGIKARGGKLETEPADMPWGARVFRINDLDGYKFAISGPLAASTS